MPFVSPDHGTIPGCLRIASNQAAPAGQAEGTERSAWVTFFLKNHQRRLWKGVTPLPPSPSRMPHPAQLAAVAEHRRSSQNQSIRAQALFAKASLGRRAVRVAFLLGQMGCPRVLPWLTHPRFLCKQPWPAPMASKEAQSPVPLFLSLLPPPWVSQAPGYRTEPLGLQRPPAYWSGLSIGQNSCPWTFVDLGDHLFKSDARLGLRLSPSFQRAQHCQRGTTAPVCSRGAREDGWFSSSPAVWAKFRGTLDFAIWRPGPSTSV